MEHRRKTSRPRAPASMLVLLSLLLACGAARAGEGDAAAAAGRALAWLDANLTKLPEVQGTPQKPFTCAVAGLASLMASGTRSGGSIASDARAYLLQFVKQVGTRSRDPEQLPEMHGRFSSDRLVQYTWPLAQAGMFFSELTLRGQGGTETRHALKAIAGLLQEAQDENGGWGHGRIRGASTPATEGVEVGGRRFVSSGYPSTLLAASNCVAAALGTIEATLGKGTVRGLDRAREYYRNARLGNGNFPYDPSQRRSGSSLVGVSRTGGALMAMHFLGVSHADPDLRGSLEFLLGHLEYASEGHGSSALNLAHSALALRLLDKKGFARFREMYFPRILAKQSEEGDFDCVCEGKAFGTSCDSPRDGLMSVFADGQRAYVTALYAFVLLLEDGRLEILEKPPVPAPLRAVATKEGRRR